MSRLPGSLTEADLARAEVFTLDTLDDETDGAAEPLDGAPVEVDGEEGPRRRRRRGGRGRGRGRGRGEGAEAGAEAGADADGDVDVDMDAIIAAESVPVMETRAPRRSAARPPRELDDDAVAASGPKGPRTTPFGSVWDSQIGTPSRSAEGVAPLTDDEDFDEPEIPEYLIAEQRRSGGGGGGGNRGPRGGRSAYQAAMSRERYGRGGGGGGINRYPDVSGRGAPPREDRSYDRGDRDRGRPQEPRRSGGGEWSEVPPELEAQLRAQLTARPAGAAPAARSEVTSAAAAAPTADVAPTAAKPRATRTRKPAATAPTDAPTAPTRRAAPRSHARRGRRSPSRRRHPTRPRAKRRRPRPPRRAPARRRHGVDVGEDGGRARSRAPHARRRPSSPPTRAESPLVDRARTRGHPAALAAIDAMIRAEPPHALLLSGPGGVGKTTLALDLAAGLLCLADPGERPCRRCRGCRLVEHGDHPDVHRLTPAGPGGQIVIGGAEAPYRGVRDLIGDLSLRSLEGGRRVAIIESAHRMNEDAQGALLKTLEEPPDGVTIVLCADDDARLLPTIRSRCARIRLGPVGVREIESILAEAGVADAPTAARVARLAGGRPGVAMAYALAPDALRARAELARTLLDLLDAGPSARLAAVRSATPVALTLAAALEAGATAARLGTGDATAPEATPKRRRSARAAAAEPAPSDPAPDTGPDDADIEADPGVRAIPPAQRRRGAESLVAVAIDIARDLALAGVGGNRSLHSVDLLEEISAAATALPPGAAVAALGRAERAAEAIAANVNPELVLDDLVLAWPRRPRAA